MQVKRENVSKTKIKLTIEVSASNLKSHIDKVYKDLVKNVKIKGFRPGKAPQSLVEKEVGQDKFYQEVLDSVLPNAYYKAIMKEKIVTVSPPDIKVTKYAPTGGLEFEAKVEILPEFKIDKYKDIKVPEREIKVDKKDIESSLKELQERFAEYREISRKAKKGDKAEINFEGKKNKEVVDGTKGEKYPVEIGKGIFLPEFEENLIGMSKGEERTFDVTFPKDYHEKRLAGEKITFKAKIVSLSEKILPELNDTFANKLGGMKSIEELKDAVKKDIGKAKQIEERKRLEESIMTKLSEKTNIEIPEALIMQEISRMKEEASMNLSKSGLTLDKYMEMSKKSADDIEKEMKPDAEKRVKYGLVLSKVAEEEKIGVTDKEIEEEKGRILASQGENKDEMEKRLKDDNVLHQIRNSIISRKTFDKLIEYSKK